MPRARTHETSRRLPDTPYASRIARTAALSLVALLAACSSEDSAGTPTGDVPDASGSDGWSPDASTPDASTSDGSGPDSTDQAAPDASTPDGSGPDSGSTTTYENLTELHTWTSEPGAQDWSGYPINVGPFASHQMPWAMWDAAPGEQMVSTVSEGDISGWPQMRTVADLSMGSGMVKGAPAIWLGKHNNVVSHINPFVTGGEDGYWSDGPSEVRVSTGTRDFKDHSDPGITFWNAIQLYAYRTQFLGDNYTGAGTDGIDIQLRFHANNFTLFQSELDAQIGQFTSAGITWNIGLNPNYNGQGTWAMLCWPDGEAYVDEIVDFDVLGLVNQCRALFNADQGTSDARWWVWGVQVWMEPRSGSIDTATEGFEVTIDGTVYGAFDRATTSGGESSTPDDTEY